MVHCAAGIGRAGTTGESQQSIGIGGHLSIADRPGGEAMLRPIGIEALHRQEPSLRPILAEPVAALRQALAAAGRQAARAGDDLGDAELLLD